MCLVPVPRYYIKRYPKSVDHGSSASRYKPQSITFVFWRHEPPSKRIISRCTTLPEFQVQGTGKFAITRAYNFAARHSRGSRILKLDADSILLPKFVEHHPHVGGIYYAGNWKAARSENERHLNGVLFVDRATWAAANGFDERIVGYGHDDDNLQMRLSRVRRFPLVNSLLTIRVPLKS